MHLAEAIEALSPGFVIDPDLPLQLGPRTFSSDASKEALRLIESGDIDHVLRSFDTAKTDGFYWQVNHITYGMGEIFSLPSALDQELLTAVEISVLKALSVIPIEDHADLICGKKDILIGEQNVTDNFYKIVKFSSLPLCGDSILFNNGGSVTLDAHFDDLQNQTILSCIENSFISSPLKFRFLELYRIVETRFLSEIKSNLDNKFRSEPKLALEEAIKSLKSELNQIIMLAQRNENLFELLYNKFHSIKNTNKFCASLFKKLENSESKLSSPKWTAGATLFYYVRCAVVHAGEKDIIYENFDDSEDVIVAVIENIEIISLKICGMEIA